MSKLSNLIFHNSEHYITSPFGYRKSFSTSAGATSSFHSGVDYGTNGEKKRQYAIANGTVLSCGIDTAYGGAKFVWVSYPALGVKMLHYHLDKIFVKAGQAVNKNTVIGTTGKSGKATGVHLHLGVKKLSGGDYIDPEKWSKEVLEAKYTTGNYKVVKVGGAGALRVRKGAAKTYSKIKFSKMTKSAQKKILAIAGKKVNGYVKGMTFTVLEVKNNNWGRTPSGWVNLTYCERI